MERSARVLRARGARGRRNCGGPMPEFRRGWARWLPREAERDLFHPSLKDLRADHVTADRARSIAPRRCTMELLAACG